MAKIIPTDTKKAKMDSIFFEKDLVISQKSSNFVPALEGVAEIVLQPSISMTDKNGIQTYAPETAGTPERGV